MPANLPINDLEKWNLHHQIQLRIVKFLNIIMVTVPFAVCWYAAYAKRLSAPFYFKGDIAVILFYAVLYIIFVRIYNGLNISLCSITEETFSQALAAAICDFVFFIVTLLLMKHLPPVLPLVMTFAVQLLLALAWSFGATQWYFRTFDPIKTLVIWDLRNSEDFIKLLLSKNLDARFEIVRSVSIKECRKDLINMLANMQAVFLCGIHSHDRNVVIKYCVEKGIRVYVIPRVGDMVMSGAHAVHMLHLPMLMVERFNPSPEYLIVKRAMDIVLSAIALIVLSPIMIITSIAIKATDGGDVLYRQVRLTRGRKRFQVLKFRSMRMDAEKDGVARLSSGTNDDRITPVGKIIRACRIDELPQLFNILKGEMSIVGPRPERPEIAAQYEKEMPEFSLRLQAKAGLTGYAQIYGKYNTTPYDKLLMDLYYIAHPSIAEDLSLMFATVKVLFMPESTEGIEEGQTTAQKKSEGVKEEKSEELAESRVKEVVVMPIMAEKVEKQVL